MKKRFLDKRFNAESADRIEIANGIITRYLGMGLRLTLRQLYYQFVAHHGLPNTERSYKSLAALMSNARLAGLVDWNAIEDRGREPITPSEWDGIPSLVESALRAYRLDRWKGQESYAELWVEKQALAGVLAPLANEAHVTLMVNKGYSSTSAMYESSRRFRSNQGLAAGAKRPVLFYLGDHDPSGEDMVRDIGDRMEVFGVEGLEVRKLALTMDQVRQYNPPPNPAKLTDPRAQGYIAEHGDSSWEVDALDPDTLATLIREAFAEVIDKDRMDAVIAQEEKDKDALREAAANL
jgi:hypothetical protein